MGSIDHPLSPLSVALAAEATFVARSIDAHVKHLGETLKRAADHKGTSLVEVYQNCNVFNDGAMAYAQEKKQRADNVVELEHGKPLIFANGKKGVRLVGNHLEVVNTADVPADDLLIHDEKDPNPSIHMMMARMSYPTMPEPIGVLRAVEGVSTYDDSDQRASPTSDEIQRRRRSGRTLHLRRHVGGWLGVRSQESGTRNQESGTRSQEPGVRNQESGTRGMAEEFGFESWRFGNVLARSQFASMWCFRVRLILG